MTISCSALVVPLLLILAAARGCSGQEAELITIMKEVSHALECFGNTLQESLRVQNKNHDVLRDLHSLPDRVETLSEDIEELKQKLANKEKMEDMHTEYIQDLKDQLKNKDTKIGNLQGDLDARIEEHRQSSLKAEESNAKLEKRLAEKDKQIHDLQEKLTSRTKENEESSMKVQDLDRRLGESQRHAEQLEELVQQLNKTMVALESTSTCKQQHLQEVKELMKEFGRKKDWAAMRRGLEAVLDHSSEEYRQLESMEYRFTGPLFEVGFKGHLELASLLLCGGLPVNMSDGNGYTTLHGAAQGGHLPLVKLLRDSGGDINASTVYGYTPFILAAYWNHLEVVQWLAAAGADITARNKGGGNSALDWAKENGHTAVVKYLQQLLH